MGAGLQDAISSLADVQRQSMDWASARRSPFGLPLPRVAMPVTVFGFSALPAGFGTEVLLVEFQARANWFFLGCAVVLGFAGNGNAPNPGDVKFSIDIDRPLGSDAGYDEKNYQAVPLLLGNFQLGPQWPVEFRHRNTETVRIKGTPIANMGIGASNFLTAALMGWEWPEGGYEG